jgi:hypothetical protein
VVTESVAAREVTDPTLFVKTASTVTPFWASVRPVSVSVLLVAPSMRDHVVPPSKDWRHRTDAVGSFTVAVKVAVSLVCAVTLVGLVLTRGSWVAATVRVAGGVTAVPLPLVKDARYW